MSEFKKCVACAEEILVEAKLCKHCRTSQDIAVFSSSESKINQAEFTGTNQKNRSTALGLAVLFGFWSFLYTYKIDKTKFWAFFLAQGFLLAIYACYFYWLGANSYELVVNQGISINGLIAGGNLMLVLVQAPGWIYALVVQIGRTDHFFSEYSKQ
jgi:hypothetical protein